MGPHRFPFVFLGIAVLLLACREAPHSRDSLDIVDDLDHPIDASEQPQRVVALIPSVTELIIALGEHHRLVARTDFDADPLVADLPSVGGGLDPNMESLVALQPDLVIAWSGGDQPMVRQLRDLGITVYVARNETVADLERHAQRLGALFGVDDRADSLVGEFKRGLSRIHNAVRSIPPRSVLYIIWHDPPTTTGPGTFIDSIITIAGGRNVFDDAQKQWPQVSMETILRRNPDVLVLSAKHAGDSASVAWLYRTPGWSELPAVQQGRVFVVEADLFNRPGPRVVEAATRLAGWLHPEASRRLVIP